MPDESVPTQPPPSAEPSDPANFRRQTLPQDPEPEPPPPPDPAVQALKGNLANTVLDSLLALVESAALVGPALLSMATAHEEIARQHKRMADAALRHVEGEDAVR